MSELKLLLISIFTLITFAPSCQGRVPSAHWPKSCDLSNPPSLEDLNHSNYQVDPKDKEESLHKSLENPKYMAIVVHGLNLRPSKMEAFEQLLQKNGAEILRVALLGHRGSLEEQKQLTWNQWMDQYHDHYCWAKARATKLNIPLINLSFSLGALVTLGHIQNSENSPYQKLIMIAPAAWIHWYGKIPSWFSFLGGEIGIPSKNLKEYRSQKTTSLAAYEAMSVGRDEVEELSSKNINNQTLIIMDPDDELVSLKKIKKFVEEKELNNSWKILEISNKNHSLKKSYHHLIVDEKTMGSDSWKAVIDELSSFISGE